MLDRVCCSPCTVARASSVSEVLPRGGSGCDVTPGRLRWTPRLVTLKSVNLDFMKLKSGVRISGQAYDTNGAHTRDTMIIDDTRRYNAIRHDLT